MAPLVNEDGSLEDSARKAILLLYKRESELVTSGTIIGPRLPENPNDTDLAEYWFLQDEDRTAKLRADDSIYSHLYDEAKTLIDRLDELDERRNGMRDVQVKYGPLPRRLL